MKILTSFSLVVATALSNLLYAQQLPPSIVWQKCFGGSADDKANVIIKTVDDGFLIVGSSKSNDGDVTGHHGPNTTTDAWVLKVSSDGSRQWQKSLGGSGDDHFRSVLITEDGGYLCMGETSSNDGDVTSNHGNADIWLVKLSRDGDIEWQKAYGGISREVAGNIKKAKGNRILVIGTTFSNDGDVSGNHGSGRSDIWVFKINPVNGTLLWQQCYGGTLDDQGYDLEEAEFSKFIMAADYNSPDGDFGIGPNNSPIGRYIKTDSVKSLFWQYSYSRHTAAMITKTGTDQYTTGYNYIPCYPAFSGFQVKTEILIDNIPNRAPPYNRETVFTLLKCFGPNQYTYQILNPSASARVASDYGLFAFGTDDVSLSGHHGSYDGYVVASHMNPNDTIGNTLRWKKTLGGSGADYLSSVVALNENEFTVAGYTNSNNGDVSGNHGGYDFWIVKLGKTNIIKGSVYLDYNLNGVKDGSEPFANNILVESKKGAAKSGSLTFNGMFRNSVDTGTHITSVTAGIPYFNAVPASKNTVFNTYNNSDSLSFALQPIPNQRDYAVELHASSVPRPGFRMYYFVQVTNRGTDTLANRLVKMIKNQKLSYDSASPVPTAISGDTLTWNIASLLPRETVYISVVLKIAAPPMVNIGDTLVVFASIDTTGDVLKTNNSALMRSIIRGSYDPNDKSESKGNFIYKDDITKGTNLNYLIRFQNTGNDTAFTVIIRDTLDKKVDSSSIEMISASHPYQLSIKDGTKLNWTFNSILLPDSNVNEPASHGYIAYRIKPKSTLNVGDTIKNSASIYFDFNLPVRTNTHETVVKAAPPPPSPQFTIQSTYCSNQGLQKGKINNLPNSLSGITVIAKVNGVVTPVAADSTFSFDVGTLGAGTFQTQVIYINSTAGDTLMKTFTITAAATPDVNVSASITNVTTLANPVIVTAANANGGGTTPLYTFGKDRNFTTVLQAESATNTLIINPSTLDVGDNWIYVRMKTSLTCFTTQTNTDSILVRRDAITGIIDVDDPTRVINIFPNPFSRQINLSGLNPTKSYEITIVDLNGKQLLKRQVHGSTQFNMPLHSYSSGVYVLNLYDRRKQRLIGKVRLVKQ